jgi:propanol-preferring alcohol dehydrogenase
MVLHRLANLAQTSAPLRLTNLSDPVPSRGELLVRVSTCGVCHTELDEIEGRAAPPRLPVIPGHQVVGRVARSDAGSPFEIGARVGIGWIYSTCGQCRFCLDGRENLCTFFRATGKDADGGYAEYMRVPEGFAYAIPESLSDAEAAPLLCAGAIGYRALQLTGIKDGERLGLAGFGASGHLVLQMARFLYPQSPVYVMSVSEAELKCASGLGADWVGDFDAEPPEKLDAIIDTTPVWRPLVDSLKRLERGGRLVVNAIRKEDDDKAVLAQIDYESQLWHEREVKTVANVIRSDITGVLELAARGGIRPQVQEYRLEEANVALMDLKTRKIRGAKVLRID